MSSSARCSRPLPAALLIGTLSLNGCATAGSDAATACPPVVAYSRADQARAADEIAALPADAVTLRMLSDYAVLRDQARACR